MNTGKGRAHSARDIKWIHMQKINRKLTGIQRNKEIKWKQTTRQPAGICFKFQFKWPFRFFGLHSAFFFFCITIFCFIHLFCTYCCVFVVGWSSVLFALFFIIICLIIIVWCLPAPPPWLIIITPPLSPSLPLCLRFYIIIHILLCTALFSVCTQPRTMAEMLQKQLCMLRGKRAARRPKI